MGSATTQALAASVETLNAQQVDLDTARQLFAAAHALGDSTQLASALADSAAPVAARQQVVQAVFAGSLGASALTVLASAASQRWSSPADLVDGVEELAIRAASAADAADLEGELFQFSRVVAANPDLELTLNSRRGDAQRKGELIDTILGAKASQGTVAIIRSLVAQTRGRRVRQLLQHAMNIVAAQRGRQVATVTSAQALTAAQLERLGGALSAKYGRTVTLNPVVDPSVIGGLRVQIADDVIDGSLSSRLADLRQQLVGAH